MNKADTIFFNGKVITMNDSEPRASAVAVKGEKIIGVGSDSQVMALANHKTEKIDLKGKALLPGFTDAHTHLFRFGTIQLEVNCSSPPVHSLQEIYDEIRRRAQVYPRNKWIRGFGYDELKLEEKRPPSRKELDIVAPEHPVFITRTCGHLCAVNSKALELAGITEDTPDPPGGEIEREPGSGKLTGLLKERAQYLIRNILEYSLEDLMEGGRLAGEIFAREGITSQHDCGSGWINLPKELEALQTLRQRGELLFRSYLVVRFYNDNIKEDTTYILESGLKSGFGDHMIRIGALKFLTDGSISARTAALKDPYINTRDNHGILTITPEALKRGVKICHDAGFQVSVHAIGDQAIEMTLDAFEEALRLNPRSNHRHRVEHCTICLPGLMKRVKKLNLLPVVQTNFINSLGDSYLNNLDEERARWVFPVRSYLDQGIIPVGSSDRPVAPGNPFLGIHSAVTRETQSRRLMAPEESVTVEEALKMYTLFPAYASFEENIKGSLVEGKLADMIVVPNDPTEIEVRDIKDLKVEMTVLGGKIIYSQGF